MERRSNILPVDAILTSDWHLREQDKPPVCRTDNFWDTQWDKVDFIAELQRKHRCPVFHAGDLFDYWKPSPDLLSMTSLHLPAMFHSIYGNHDLPQHNMQLAKKCGLYNLIINGKVEWLRSDTIKMNSSMFYFKGCDWDMQDREHESPYAEYKSILVWHVMTYQGVEPWVGCTAPKARKLLKQNPNFDLIVTGDNHKPFVEELDGRLLVNPGSIFRMDADQIDHRPRVYLYHSVNNSVTPVFLPIEENAVSKSHLEAKQRRDTRIDAFIDSLDDDFEAGLSFEDNIEYFRQKSKIRKPVMDIVYKSME